MTDHFQDNCIFCKLAAGAIPSTKILEDEHTIAFMDIRPAAPGHSLVIGKRHSTSLLDIDEATLLAVARSTRRVARAMDAALRPDGIRIYQLNGAAAGQTVFHYHVHIVPATAGRPGGLHGREASDPAQLEAMAQSIRDRLEAS